MIAFQWRPPWRHLAVACKHSRSIIKGKAPENCICQQTPARHASSWTQLAFPSGEGASTSTSTSPDIGFLFFYPSFHFDTIRVKSRHVKLIRRALRKNLGLSRSLSPIASTSSYQPIFSERRPPPRRHVSHTTITHSAPSSFVEQSPKTPSTFEDLQFTTRSQHNHHEQQQAHSQQRSTYSATRQDTRAEKSAPTPPPESSYTVSETLKTPKAEPRAESDVEVQPKSDTYLFDKVVARTYELIKERAPLKRIRWRLYALLRIFTANYKINNIKSGDLLYLVGGVCDLHEPLNDSESLEEIIRRTELISARYRIRAVPRRAYHRLLRTYTRSLRSKEAFTLLRKMQTMNRQIGADTYLNFVTMYAHLKEPENARMIIETMRREDIPVNQPAFASLMNAYVEAGLWDDAIDIFEYLDSHKDGHPLKPDVYTCTTLMKCYILMGAPLDEVLNILHLMQNRGLELTRKTYVHLLHAACEAGALDFAEEIFAKLDEKGKKPEANVVAFSIMIRAMLRAGRHEVSNEYYQEMKRRNLQPTSATWSILLQAYASAGKPETNAILTELLDQYLDVYLDKQSGTVRLTPYSQDTAVARGTALENVYGPVIASLAKGDGRSSLAKRSAGQDETPLSSEEAAVDMFRSMLAHPGSKPSLHLYTALLDAYRRVGKTAGVEELWPHIIAYATTRLESSPLGLAGPEEPLSGIPASKRNLLCLPLSIYIDAMSSHHHHQKVAEAWAQMQEMGFGFDVGNWNHLIAAFVRAGEFKRALWIAEELLRDAKNFKMNRSQHTVVGVAHEDVGAAQADEASLEHSVLEGDKVETPMRPPNRTWQYHKRRKEEIYTKQNDLMLSNQTSTSSLDTLVDSDILAQSNPSIPISQRIVAESMTASFEFLRQQHNAQLWTLFTSTTRMLEEALRNDESKTEEQPRAISEVGEAVDVNSKENAKLREYARTYPLTMSMIGQYRAKLRRYGLRTSS